MKYISTFSGIEAASVAWEHLGWEPLAFSEIEPYPCAVLAHRFPDVPNLGDITKIDWSETIERVGRPDVIVGGSPCQSFSLAGGRDSLAGASRLMFEYIRAVREVRPKFILWENVPGVLNTRDNAFGQLLCEIQDCGYSLAWRVLDSQFVRVPDRDIHGRIRGWYGPVAQRRRRVFLVGHLGEGSGASAAVLFEQDCLRGNLASSREKRQDLARAAKERPRTGSSECLTPWDVQSKRIQSAGGVSPSLQAGGSEGVNIQPIVMDQTLTPWDNQSKQIIGEQSCSPALCANEKKFNPKDNQPTVLQKFDTLPINDACHTLAAQDHPQAIVISTANTGANGSNISDQDLSYTLDRTNSNAVCIQGSMIGRSDSAGPQGDGVNDNVSFTLNTSDRHAVAFGITSQSSNSMKSSNPNSGIYEAETSKTIETSGLNPTCNQGGIAVVCAAGSNTRDAIDDNMAGTLTAHNQKNPPYIASEYIVRRLTPTECERLQGFPDGWTLLTDCDVDKVTELVCAALKIEDEKGIKAMRRKVEKWKEDAPDGPRYKALGNSMATNVMLWIGERMQTVSDILDNGGKAQW